MKKKNYFFNLLELSKLCLVLACLFLSTGVFSQDTSTGLILHYTFDAISGTNIPDDSGNGNVGTLQGGAKDTVGYSGNGVACTLKADYISLPANINSSLTSFTFAAWVNISALKSATRLFDFGTGTVASGASPTSPYFVCLPSFNNGTNGDDLYVGLRYRPVSGTAYNITSTSKIPVGTWAHVAVTSTWDGTNSTMTIYINGAAVGTGTMPYNPSSLGTTDNNILGVSRWAQDTNGFSGIFDDVRLYSRALTATDILTLNGLAELNKQYTALSLGDVSAVTSNLTLPTTLGTAGVTVRWATSNSTVIDTLGTVKQPAIYDATVNLTATLSQVVSGNTYTMTKTFTVKVPGIAGTPTQIAEWNFTTDNISLENDTFKVKDVQSGFVGKLMNDARIRTIGSTTQYNVLDLGNGTGYFDMGTDIGKAIYSLNDYTMMGFFRIDATYPSIATNGNFYWTFSNTADAMTDKNGYIIGSLKAESQSVSTGYYSTGNQATAPSTAASAGLGAWHHFAYVQSGTTGTIYVDGTALGTNVAMTNVPSSIALAGRAGTLYNWLGRSNYVSDVYLRKALLYDFQVLSVPVSSDDLNLGFTGFDGVQNTLDKLNNAYVEDSDYTAPELTTELNALSLGDLSAVKTDLVLPTKGTNDPSIAILWKTTNANLISASGVVTRPNYYSYNDTLTAVLTKNGQSLTKAFPATVVVKDGTQFTNDLLVKYDFSTVTDSIVTDVAEKHFTGVLKNNATVRSIGTSVKYNVLSLGDSIGYFDMGTEVGKLMYNLTDYTMSAYYRIDTSYVATGAGNFIWAFANGTTEATNQNGYVIGALNNQSVSITPGYYTAASGNQAVSFATAPLTGGWHNLTYVQSGTNGTIYVDGANVVTSAAITNLPSTALPKRGQLGTLYNWIGRSCFAGDAYLKKTLVYDFRLYRVALTDDQIQNTLLNIGTTINNLEAAYAEAPSAVKTVSADSKYKVISGENEINIQGLNGSEKVTLFDITGRQLKVTNTSSISVNSGAYVVRINNYITKVMVK